MVEVASGGGLPASNPLVRSGVMKEVGWDVPWVDCCCSRGMLQVLRARVSPGVQPKPRCGGRGEG